MVNINSQGHKKFVCECSGYVAGNIALSSTLHVVTPRQLGACTYIVVKDSVRRYGMRLRKMYLICILLAVFLRAFSVLRSALNKVVCLLSVIGRTLLLLQYETVNSTRIAMFKIRNEYTPIHVLCYVLRSCKGLHI